MLNQLHADHVDTSGTYAQKFAIIKELIETGVLKEIPVGFRDSDPKQTDESNRVPVLTNSQLLGGQQDEFDMTNGHADHIDETGRYRIAYEAKYGPISQTNAPVQEAENSWKSFLQKIIAEEKSKLKV